MFYYTFLFFRIEELACGGVTSQVRESFGETLTSLIQISARFPLACYNSVGLLCTLPFTRFVTFRNFTSLNHAHNKRIRPNFDAIIL